MINAPEYSARLAHQHKIGIVPCVLDFAAQEDPPYNCLAVDVISGDITAG